MRIAFVDHAYHRLTKSSEFFLQLLSDCGQVTRFYEEEEPEKNTWHHAFNEFDYDLIVVWQAHQALKRLSGNHPNVLFIPMYDAMLDGSGFYWHKTFAHAKVLSFSRKLHQEVEKRGAISEYVQYFPDPSHWSAVADYDDVRVFFWYRRNPIDADLVLDFCRTQPIEELVLHNAPDPGVEALRARDLPSNIRNLSMSSWTSDFADYRRALQRCNVFFAPRLFEGIGFSFLEAMASGLCVVAPNNATMNEYIANGTNGILYPFECRVPLDFERVADIGLRARETVERGYRRWQDGLPGLMEFVVTPKAELPQSGARTIAPFINADRTPPKVSVVTVCLNAEKELEATIESVLSQDIPNLEYVILDGNSSDGTVQIIQKYSGRLSSWRSMADAGVYHAMNDAIDICTGDWVVYMNAGDTFSAPDSLRRMFRHVPLDAEVVYGHHFYVTESGVKEYHPAADFETTWKRLRDGQVWFDWLAGIPGHQATAVRRDTLARFRFDTTYRIAADHDLLFRAKKEGVKFFNCDEMVSVYLGGGLSAKQYELCKKEWASVAGKYGAPCTADQLCNLLEKSRSRPRSPTSSFRRTAGTLLSNLTRAVPQLGALSQSFGLESAEGPAITGPAYFAKIADGIDFRRYGLPAFLTEMRGFAGPETWGQWTIGPVAEILFREELPHKFKLVLEGYASGKNTISPITIRIGDFKHKLQVASAPAQTYSVEVMSRMVADRIAIHIPHPIAPVELWPDDASDTRPLGLALTSLKIEGI